MASPALFLQKYEYIVFDMDGVITSEQNYWDISALSVYELLNSKSYYGSEALNPAVLLENVKKIRSEVFCSDKLITLLKERGVNSNWDLTFVVFSHMLSGRFASYEEVYRYIEKNPLPTYEMYESCSRTVSEALGLPYSDCERNASVWLTCRDVFQEWYLGSEGFERTYGKEPRTRNKPSMERREVPVIDKDDIVTVLSTLYRDGKKLLVATGRSDSELSLPFKLWDIGKYFEKESLATYTKINLAEKRFAEKGEAVQLSKPHPYIFLKALFPNVSDEDILAGNYDREKIKKTLVVGDAGSDILAAKTMGADFFAVLTGVSGKRAEKYFIENKAEYIYPSIMGLIV